jgi:hypothetical protein
MCTKPDPTHRRMDPADPPHWRLVFALLTIVTGPGWTPFLRLLILFGSGAAVASLAPPWTLLSVGAIASALTAARRRTRRQTDISPE